MGSSGIPEIDISGIIPEVRLKTDLIFSENCPKLRAGIPLKLRSRTHVDLSLSAELALLQCNIAH